LKEHYYENFVYASENEARYRKQPENEDKRLEFLVDQLEGDTLSFGSKADQAQSQFHAQGVQLPWLEIEDDR
jgi:hypothetical protein